MTTSNSKTKQAYSWIIISLCAFFLFYKYVLQVSPSVMTQQLMMEFKVDGAGLGNLAATFFYAYLIMQLCAGPLLDHFKPKLLISFSIAICALGAFSFAHTSSLFVAQISRALIGAGAAFATVSYMKMSAIWFKPNQMGFVDGLLATAAMAGALCGQIPLTILVTHTGWQHSLDACALFGFVLALVFFIVVKDKKEATTAHLSPKLKLIDFLLLFKSKKNWLLTLYSGLAFTPVAVLGGLWGNPFFEEAHHLTALSAASFTSCIFIGLAAGSPLFGMLADRFDNRIRVMVVGTSLALISLVAAIYISSLPLWLFGLALFTFGFGTGAFMSCYALGKELNSIKLAATVVALINTGDALFGSFTEPLIGKILDFFWTGKIVNTAHYFSVSEFHIAFLLLPLYLVVAVTCLIILDKMK